MKIQDEEVAAPQAIVVPKQPKEREESSGILVLVFSFAAVALLGSLTVMLFL